jgi:hypothetical protein
VYYLDILLSKKEFIMLSDVCADFYSDSEFITPEELPAALLELKNKIKNEERTPHKCPKDVYDMLYTNINAVLTKTKTLVELKFILGTVVGFLDDKSNPPFSELYKTCNYIPNYSE